MSQSVVMDALEELRNVGLSDELLDTLLNDLIVKNKFDEDADRRCAVALAWYRAQGNNVDPVECSSGFGDDVDIDGREYRVLTEHEADAAVREHIADSLWAFNVAWLAIKTGLDESIFAGLVDKCESANDAVRALIDSTCGLDDFVEDSVRADGRGHFLNGYDGAEEEYCAYRNGKDDERESSDWYHIYRQN